MPPKSTTSSGPSFPTKTTPARRSTRVAPGRTPNRGSNVSFSHPGHGEREEQGQAGEEGKKGGDSVLPSSTSTPQSRGRRPRRQTAKFETDNPDFALGETDSAAVSARGCGNTDGPDGRPQAGEVGDGGTDSDGSWEMNSCVADSEDTDGADRDEDAEEAEEEGEKEGEHEEGGEEEEGKKSRKSRSRRQTDSTSAPRAPKTKARQPHSPAPSHPDDTFTPSRRRGSRWDAPASDRESTPAPAANSFPTPSAAQMANRLPTDPDIPIATHRGLMDLLPLAAIQSRGVLDTRRSMSYASFLVHTFGSSNRDLKIYAQCQTRWNGQVLWPSRNAQRRRQLDDPVGGGGADARGLVGAAVSVGGRERGRGRGRESGDDLVGGMGRSGYYSDRQVRAEMRSWSWWRESGAKYFAQHQRHRSISAAEATEHLPRKMKDQRIILGPADRPRLFDLPAGGTLEMGEAWGPPHQSAFGSGRPPNRAGDGVEGEGGGETKPAPLKRGWIISVGARVQCLEWVPNVPTRTQYLAVAGAETRADRGEHGIFQHSDTPAFSPQPAYPASFQIWAFSELAAHPDSEPSGKMDFSSSPRLDAVVCFPWGPVRQLQWCPIATDKPLGLQPDGTVDLGLVAGIWADGRVRVVWIRYKAQPVEPAFVYLQTSAIEIVPSNTVASAVGWLSGESVAVGCANGCVGVWNISDPAESGPDEPVARPGDVSSSGTPFSPPPPLRPLFVLPACSTYILNLTVLHPHSHLVAVSSMSGFVHLVDLSAPIAEHVTTPRTRLISRPLAFHPLEQCILTVDENYAVRAHPVRRMHNEVFVGRLGGVANDMATSPVQPTILVAGQDGMVAAMVMGGRLAGLRRGGRVGGVWFVYQWRRERTGRLEGPGPEGLDDLHSRPLSRFVDGFVPEIVSSAAVPTAASNNLSSSAARSITTPGAKKRRRKARALDEDDDDDDDDGGDSDLDNPTGHYGEDAGLLDGSHLDELDIGGNTPARSRQNAPSGHRTSQTPRGRGGRAAETATPAGGPSFSNATSAANSGSFVFNRVGSAVFSTIHEPEAAVTRVSWHPGGWASEGVDFVTDGDRDRSEEESDGISGVDARSDAGSDRIFELKRRAARFGGWAAAGTGSGLVRVEDLAVD